MRQEVRLFSPSAAISFDLEEPSTWNFVDYDTRRWIVFEGPTNLFGCDEGEQAIKALLPVLDQLQPDVTKVTFMSQGKWVATNFIDDDVTPMINFPTLGPHELDLLQKTQTDRPGYVNLLRKDNWVEINRISGGLDLIEVQEEWFVFKYVIVDNPRPLKQIWSQAFIHRALSHHENIVPFGHFVMDGPIGQNPPSKYVGFTTKYIPGGSLDVRQLGTFKSIWVKELIDLIDCMNLKYGVMHQDIAARNMLLQENRILLFDFEYAAFIGSDWIIDWKDDVKDLCFTIYHLLTGDDQFETVKERELGLILSSENKWPLKRNLQLENSVTTDEIKRTLQSWVNQRISNLADPTSSFEFRHMVVIPERNCEITMMAEPEEGSDELDEAYLVREVGSDVYVTRWERSASAHQKRRKSSRIRHRLMNVFSASTYASGLI